MTEATVLELIREDFRGVKASVDNLGGEVSGMKSTVTSVKETLDRHETAIKETREAQLQCSAAGGWVGLNREMKEVKRRQSDQAVHVADELKEIRGDTTGQIDVPPVSVKAVTNGGVLKGLFRQYGHWFLFALFALGVYLGTGGDEERTVQVLQNLREIGRKVEKIEKTQTEPVRIPVPVTASDMYSEEILP